MPAVSSNHPPIPDSGDELADLVAFLDNKTKSEVLSAALDIVQGLAATPDGTAQLKRLLLPLLKRLLRLLSEPGGTSQKALSTLVNLSHEPAAAAELRQLNAVGRAMDYLREGTCPHPRLLVMLLSNLSVDEQCCRDLLQLGQDRLEGLHMAVLLKRFVMSGMMHDGSDGSEDPYEHVAAILTNVTRLKEGRLLLLQPGRGLLQAMLAQLQAGSSSLRRLGCSGAIKNCCMSAQADGTLQMLLSDEEALRRMLGPIGGSTVKEPEGSVREAMAQAVHALAETEEGCTALWRINAPEVLRKGYEYEEHPGVCMAMEHAAEHFLASEGYKDKVQALETTATDTAARQQDTLHGPNLDAEVEPQTTAIGWSGAGMMLGGGAKRRPELEQQNLTK